ncbi:hypothetical protein AVEN_169854-1 [Araneus ventricosus]|uniref:Uncharacterized protein n=1 Tax=Araneus ventricosus TaxID=182803 RepID=A0A4Y2HJK6_ARAVE|nr:hypothetical protein AVEN_169854-1 [Araneus ventricosus]
MMRATPELALRTPNFRARLAGRRFNRLKFGLSKKLRNKVIGGRGGLVIRCALEPEGSRVSNLEPFGSKADTLLYSTGDPPCIGPVARQIILKGSNVLLAVLVRKFGEGTPSQVSSSSDSGPKLRDLFQNSPRVASKRDVNVTKLKI